MKEKKHYISLKLKGNNTYHHHGECLRLTERIVNIGESVDCDVRFDADDLMPEYYASIIQNEDGKSWRIVKRSQHIDINIIGKGSIGYAHQLTDGDLIQFGNQPLTLCFQTHFDNQYNEEGNNTHKWLWVGVAAICLLGGIITALITKDKDAINEQDILPLEESVCLIKVDSVKQVKCINGLEDSVMRTRILTSDAPTGTAFMTTDGKLVTARHCVEYWLGRNLDLTTKVDNLPDEDIVKWAIEAESYNQQHPSESEAKILMKVWFSIFNFLGEKKYSFASTDPRVHINKEKDGIFLLADFSKEYYWRSIRPYFKDRKMAMGDILWIDGLTENGKVTLASEDDMNTIERGTKLIICGYPMTGTGDKRMISATGSIKSKPMPETENLFFESNINHGFSGGPVMMKSGSSIVAVGVVSCVDSVSSGLFKWAVPVTELNHKSDK